MDLQGSFWESDVAAEVSSNASAITAMLADLALCRLPALLGENDILQECKSGNTSLIQFLTQPGTILDMMALIVSGSSLPNSNEEKSTSDHCSIRALGSEWTRRLAFAASEVVACEVAEIIDAIACSKPAMMKLFSLISPGDARVDCRRAGHFRKVVAVLIQKRFDAVAQFLTQNPAIVYALINQIDNTSILEVIIMIGWDDGNPENTSDRKWLFDLKFIPAIVKLLRPDYSEFMHINASHALIDMLLKCPASSTSILVNHLSSSPVLNTLINNIISGPPSVFENGLGVVSVIVQRQTAVSQGFEDELFAEDIPFSMIIILDKLPAIIEFAVNSPLPNLIPSPMGGEVHPLGSVRLKLAELCLALLRSGIQQAQATMIESHFIPTLISYFVEFKWNSILHFIVENIALAILNPNSCPALLQEFLQHGNFAPRAIELYGANRELATQRKAQFGNIGHTLRILNLVVDLCVQQPEIVEWVHPDFDAWRTFLNDRLALENERLSIQLGGFKPDLEQQKADLQNPHALSVDDEFFESEEFNFEPENNQAQTQAMFDVLNATSTPFDNEAWPAISFDDQEFHIVEDDDVFEPLIKRYRRNARMSRGVRYRSRCQYQDALTKIRMVDIVGKE